MKKFFKIMAHIHVSDWRLSVISGVLFSAAVLALGAGIALAVVYAFTGFDAKSAVIAAVLIFTGVICFLAWRKLVWDKFAHTLTDLS